MVGYINPNRTPSHTFFKYCLECDKKFNPHSKKGRICKPCMDKLRKKTLERKVVIIRNCNTCKKKFKTTTIKGRICNPCNDLKKALLKHMADEEADRKDLDKKLSMHTIILVIVGLGVTGENVSQLIPFLKVLLGG